MINFFWPPWGKPAEAAKKAGKPRSVWSRMEEYHAVRRVITLGKEAGCHIHIAHVSTKEAVELIRKTKEAAAGESPRGSPFFLTCEAAPHHIALTETDAGTLGAESYGRVNPPLRDEEDRRTLTAALAGGLIDAIATDHAPHRAADKEGGAPGFTGLETSFGVCYRELVLPGLLSLSRLSALMSANPARIIFGQIREFGSPPQGGSLFGTGKGPDRGRIAPEQRADLVIVDTGAEWSVDPAAFKSRGRNSPCIGQKMRGKVVMTIHQGRIVFDA